MKSIKSWAEEDRPREKMLAKGKEALSNAELIAILIGSGNSKETAVDLSKRILHDSKDNLIELSRLTINDLMKYNGIGEAKAVSIAAALELGRRRRFSVALEKPSIKNSQIAYECFYAHLSDLNHEQFWIMLLNNANKVIKLEKIGVGGMTGTTADPKKIFKSALENNAASVMLCHNHPSGNVIPSNADKQITNNLVKAGQFLEIKILDHIIIGNDNYFSFADEGLL
ncbi:MAG: JAB domain-containing protein [Lentimicrobiaceae bacterium]|nr:JAB domain-containing protein [Lentimicrobiaceae bacterium]